MATECCLCLCLSDLPTVARWTLCRMQIQMRKCRNAISDCLSHVVALTNMVRRTLKEKERKIKKPSRVRLVFRVPEFLDLCGFVTLRYSLLSLTFSLLSLGRSYDLSYPNVSDLSLTLLTQSRTIINGPFCSLKYWKHAEHQIASQHYAQTGSLSVQLVNAVPSLIILQIKAL